MRTSSAAAAWLIVGALLVVSTTAQESDEKAVPSETTETPADAPSEKRVDAPAETPADAPAEEPAEEPARTPAEGQDAAASTAEFQRVLGEFRETLAELRVLQEEYREADESRQAEIEEQWNELVAKGRTLEEQLLAVGEKAFEADPAANGEAAEMLTMLAVSLLTFRDEMLAEQSQAHQLTDNFFRVHHLTKLLLDGGYENDALYEPAGLAAYAMGEFDAAEEYLRLALEKKQISRVGREYLANVKSCKENWPKEQEIRKAEAEADDLPRVKLTTSKGDIVLEMFENEAPNTVANFISLVDKQYYDGLTFHRVLPGFMAQGGCPRGDGGGDPGYKIPCECRKPGYRRHFGGSLSMAKTAKPDTGGSQFFLTFIPTSFLDGRHTVFGRVVEGFEVLYKLQRRDPDTADPPEPDKILKAEVLSRRNHEYVPKKTGEEFDS